ncbi:hypothetical protein SRABI106_01948 [Rahnella aquatilis]|nr:hypothetical protein SRABI106_01948 [Rahnella aquatilis]
MSGLSGFYRDFGRFFIADLSDHNHIRILT